MRIDKTKGIENNREIIPERDFNEYGVFSTEEAIKNYFLSYGYEFAAVYNLDEDLIIVQNKNTEIEGLLKDYNIFDVINYKTGEFHTSKLNIDKVSEYRKRSPEYIFNIQFQIIFKYGIYKLVSINDGKVLIEAKYMQFIDSNLVVYEKYGIYYILNLIDRQTYPLIKKEEKVYHGHNADSFIDMRKAMFCESLNTLTPIHIENCDLDSLVASYPYGQKRGRTFRLLNNQIHYGISLINAAEIKEIWYECEEARDEAFESIFHQVESILLSSKQKTKEKK